MQIFSPVINPAISEQRFKTILAISIGFHATCEMLNGVRPSYTLPAVSISRVKLDDAYPSGKAAAL